MKAALISMGSTASEMTAAAMKKYFTEVQHLQLADMEVSLGGRKPEILYQGKPLPAFDCVYVKGSYKYAPVLRAITTLLPPTTYTPISSQGHTIGRDKVLTHLALQVTNVPQPTTYVVATSLAAKKIIKKMHYPIVMKLPGGTHGKGVMLADSESSAASMIDALGLLKQPFLIQEYVETGETDTRAFVIGNKIVAAMKRTAVQGEKRANLHAGGTGESTILDAKTKKVALQAARAIGAEICGVDILESVRGPMAIEVNLSPGLQGITKATGVNVADKIAKFLYEQTKILKEGGENPEVLEELLGEKELVLKLDFRGEKILLPEIITNLSTFQEGDEVVVKVDKGKLIIEKT